VAEGARHGFAGDQGVVPPFAAVLPGSESRSGELDVTMKMNLTKKEYRLLLDLVYIGDWVMHAHEEEESEDTEDYRMLIQKIYGLAKEMGFDSLVESDSERNEYFPTRQYEETSRVFEFIEAYEDMSFWDELTQRLVDRDVQEEVGGERRERMSPEDYYTLAGPIAARYEREFSASGIANMRLWKARR
jgi:hypothetical protein